MDSININEDCNNDDAGPRRSERLRGKPEINYNYLCNKNDVSKYYDPKTWKTWKEMLSLNDIERNKWLEAAKDEFKSLNLNKTWSLVNLPKDKNLVSNKYF